MITIMKLIAFSLLFLSLNFLPLAVAKGSLLSSNTSGYVEDRYVRSGRRLFGEQQLTQEEYRAKLDKLAQGYMTNSDLEKAIKAFRSRCSSISRIYSIGKSVLGVPLWVIEISDKPGKEEAEPAFKGAWGILCWACCSPSRVNYHSGAVFHRLFFTSIEDVMMLLIFTLILQFIGNVHGDEPVGRELLLLLANWLCDNHMKDPLATLIVSNVHLHILPSMNPDGFSSRMRNNANDIDLNRDFPDQFFPMNDDLAQRQPETKAIMSWIKEIQFTASASLHGGALVANYPWDGTEDRKKDYHACPDDKTFTFMASLYSHSHYNMSLSKEFPGGITNGALWYPIYGGMQDWNYIHGGCFELTLEISDNKWPDARELPTIWEFNKLSMLNLVASLVKTGIHGRTFASDHGGPLPASVSIKGIDYRVKASQSFADYHRLLASGEQYEVIATMPGYKSKSTRIVLGDEAMTVDFVLDPLVTSEDDVPSQRGCDCGSAKNSKLNLSEYLPRSYLGFSLLLVSVLVFLFFLLKRKVISKHLKQRELTVGTKRPLFV